MKKIPLVAPAALLACLGCNHTPHIQPDQAAPIAAKVISISESRVPNVRNLEGVVVARQVANISPQVMAPIAEIRVHEGDSVRKGEVIVRLSSAELQSAVEQSQAQLLTASQQKAAAEAQKNLAATTYERYSTLNERHSVTPHEFDQVKAQLDAASAQLQAAAAQVAAANAAVHSSEAANSYTTIRAPFNGVVIKKLLDAGAMASPGQPLLQIEAPSDHEIDIQVNEAALGEFHQGAPVQVSIEGLAKTVAAKVREVIPSGDPAAHSFTVKIGLPALRGIYSGMTATVLVPGREGSLVLIPKSAVRHRGQLDSVLALDSNSVAQIRYISLGQERGNEVEVISGVASGDRILSEPNDALIGCQIEPQR
jgi:RND family efflux transporter MFP subunit